MSEAARGAGDEPVNPMDVWGEWLRAWGIRAPLSGDVTQDIETSLVRISLPAAGDPALERRIVEDVASYGRQLGRVLDVVDVLVRRALPAELSAEDQGALKALEALRRDIEAARTRAAADRVDRLVADIERLRRDGDDSALRRLRAALGDD